MALKLTAPPGFEPFVAATDASLRQHLRLDVGDTSQDSLIGLYIAHARETAEHQCRRAFITQSWLMTLDKFPSPGLETSSA
ncbi:MAG: phage head-tail connector protein, partial [Betaproteobacteria bacterium]